MGGAIGIITGDPSAPTYKWDFIAMTDFEVERDLEGTTKQQAEANANLIAAAPELLQAAQAARAELSAMHGYLYPKCDGGCPADAILQQLAQVIAKAKGERS
jgi:hypothetical protein